MRHPERDVEGAVPYGGIGQLSSVFNHPEGIHSCAMAQFMVKPIHAPRQFMPARAIHWPSAAMPPPAGCYLKYWEMPGFQQDNPPVSFADSLLCTRRPWDGANPEDIGRCGGRGEAADGRQVAAPTLTRPYVNTPLRLRRGGIRKGTSRAPSPTRVRWKWYDVIVGAAICRPPTPDHNPRKRAAD